MRLITLNTWGGKKFDALIDFIRREEKFVDIFCFQEVFSTSSDVRKTNGHRANLYQELHRALPAFHSRFEPYLKNHNLAEPTDFHLELGTAIFVRDRYSMTHHGRHQIHRSQDDPMIGLQYETIPRHLQWMQCLVVGVPLTIINIHGMWFEGDKIDNAQAITQSERVVEFLKTIQTPIIIAGDFNLWPETTCIQMIENRGLKNLITAYNITSTRPRDWPFPHPYADYVFASSNLQIVDFQALPDEVSDHLPLALDFAMVNTL
ncbi:MAG: endonuclease/exonuclease/phosphatase family protein [Patescibacteria group bacterium]